MENKQGYDPSEFEDDDYTTPQPDAGKSIRGYRIVIIILSVILAALSVLYFSIHRQQMLDNELLQACLLYTSAGGADQKERGLDARLNPAGVRRRF